MIKIIENLLKKLNRFIKRIAIIILWLILLPLCSFGIFYSLTWSIYTAIFLFPICVITIIFLVHMIEDLKKDKGDTK